jgi:membrane-associated phospholipid phosphatase
MAMALVLSIDGQANACPSLHAALAAYTALCVPMLAAGARQVATITIGAWIWATAIAYSTLPTRRHVAFDVAAGGALAFVVFLGVVRRGDSPRRVST